MVKKDYRVTYLENKTYIKKWLGNSIEERRSIVNDNHLPFLPFLAKQIYERHWQLASMS